MTFKIVLLIIVTALILYWLFCKCNNGRCNSCGGCDDLDCDCDGADFGDSDSGCGSGCSSD